MAYVEDLTTPATGDVAMRRFKTRAVLAGWSVAASGDGRSAYGASSDVISADSGAGSLDTSGAWMRLRMSGTTRELLIIRKATSIAWTVRYSVAGFSGGSPSATVAPTATDSQTLIDGTLLMADGTYRWLLCVEDAAPWYVGAVAIPTGGGAPQTIIALWPMRSGSFPSADTDPYVALAYFNASGACTLSQLSNIVATNGAPTGWFRHGLSSSAWTGASFCYPLAWTAMVATNGPHGATGEELPIEIPVLLAGTGPTHRGPKGYARDARYCLSPTGTTPHGTHLENGSRYWIRVGDLWLPWGSTPPAL